MYTIKVVLKESENGVDTLTIGRVVYVEFMKHFRRDGFHDIYVGGTLRIEDYDGAVWRFELDKIKKWSVE